MHAPQFRTPVNTYYIMPLQTIKLLSTRRVVLVATGKVVRTWVVGCTDAVMQMLHSMSGNG